MKTDPEDYLAALQAAILTFDVPSFKTDLSKPGNVTWLLANLKTRNSKAPGYSSAMGLLCYLAEHLNLLKEKELRRLRTDLGPAGNLYPHQLYAALRMFTAKTRIVFADTSWSHDFIGQSVSRLDRVIRASPDFKIVTAGDLL